MKSIKSAIKTDLFTADLRYQKLDQLGDPFMRIGVFIDFTALVAQVDGADLGIETPCIILRMNKWHSSFWIATAVNVSVTCWMPRACPIAQPSGILGIASGWPVPKSYLQRWSNKFYSTVIWREEIRSLMPPWSPHPSSILPGKTKEQIKEKAMPVYSRPDLKTPQQICKIQNIS